MTGKTLRIIVPLFLASFLAFGYNNIFMTLTPLFSVEIGATMSEAGLQSAVFLIVAIALRFFFGPLADRNGTKLVMTIGIAAFVLAGLVFALCTEFWQILCVRCVQAIGLSAFFPCATATVASASPVGRVGFFLGVFRFVTTASLLLGPLLSYALVQASGFRICFFVMGICAIAALVLIVTLPGKWRAASTDLLHQPRVGLGSLLRHAFAENPRFITYVLAATFLAALGYGLLLSFTALFVGKVRPDMNSGLYFTFIGIGGLVANLIIGWLSDRIDQNKLLAACFVCMGAGIAALSAFASYETAFYLSGVFAGLGYSGAITAVLTLITVRVSEKHRTSVLALQQNGIDLGIACASGVFGIAFACAADGAIVFAAEGTFMIALALAAFIFSAIKSKIASEPSSRPF